MADNNPGCSVGRRAAYAVAAAATAAALGLAIAATAARLAQGPPAAAANPCHGGYEPSYEGADSDAGSSFGAAGNRLRTADGFCAARWAPAVKPRALAFVPPLLAASGRRVTMRNNNGNGGVSYAAAGVDVGRRGVLLALERGEDGVSRSAPNSRLVAHYDSPGVGPGESSSSSGSHPFRFGLADNVGGADGGTAVRQLVLAQEPELSHALHVEVDTGEFRNETFVFASTAEAVLRWRLVQTQPRAEALQLASLAGVTPGTLPYAPAAGLQLVERTVFVAQIPRTGHSTRTLRFGPDGRLYVTIGARVNVDVDQETAGLRRFGPVDPAAPRQQLPLDWERDGEWYARGTRNEAALQFDGEGVLWGVENGMDQLERKGWDPEDQHVNNPSEEFNNFGDPRLRNGNQQFGYPYCWSEYKLADESKRRGPGSQWATQRFLDAGTHDDGWCRANAIEPAFNLPAHVAPLDVQFYEPNIANTTSGTPNICEGLNFAQHPAASFRPGDSVVSMHGSWNREQPQGYRVVKVEYTRESHPSGQSSIGGQTLGPRLPHRMRPLLYFNRYLTAETEARVTGHDDGMDVFPQTEGGFMRPVGLAFAPCFPGVAADESTETREAACLFVSSDATNEILIVYPAQYLDETRRPSLTE